MPGILGRAKRQIREQLEAGRSEGKRASPRVKWPPSSAIASFGGPETLAGQQISPNATIVQSPDYRLLSLDLLLEEASFLKGVSH